MESPDYYINALPVVFFFLIVMWYYTYTLRQSKEVKRKGFLISLFLALGVLIVFGLYKILAHLSVP